MSTHRSSDISEQLRDRVRAAYERKEPLRVVAGDSKAFLGNRVDGDLLDLSDHRGIVSHEPTELVVTVRAGTPVKDLMATLEAAGQMLPFEPPMHTDGATIGGVTACGLSGPRRPHVGAVRDFILGTRILNGRSDLLRFGGEVMKNVAGYDVSRLMAGAHGTLGVLLDISFKVLPRPELEVTLTREANCAEALREFNALATQPVPVSGAAWVSGRTYLRLSGTELGVRAASKLLGWEVDGNGEAFWAKLRDQKLPFFTDESALWRLSLPPDAPLDGSLEGHGIDSSQMHTLLDWGGAQRWVKTDQDAPAVWQAAKAAGGHATCYRGAAHDGVFQPLPGPLLAVHRRIKDAFDPAGILNPGRMYQEI